MHYLEISKDLETTEPVELTTRFEDHAVEVVGYKIANDWRKAYRIDEREYDDAEDLECDLDYIQSELQKLLTGDFQAVWTKD